MSKVNYTSHVASLRIFQLDHKKWDNLLQHKKPSVSTIQNYTFHFMYKLTLMKKIVGKTKIEKLKSLHSMTMINVVSTVTKEV